MEKLLPIIFLLFSLPSLAQENWTTLNLSGNINENYSLIVEGEQRYNHEMGMTRYFHYDAGLVRKINKRWKVGLFYREIYEIKSERRVEETRPHIDAFYSDGKHWKMRIRLEYQIKEIADNVLRFRIRPNYDFRLFKNGDPYVQTELNFTNQGFTRNRFNAGVTINLGKLQIQPGYLLESLNNRGSWKHINVIWINTKMIF